MIQAAIADIQKYMAYDCSKLFIWAYHVCGQRLRFDGVHHRRMKTTCSLGIR
jgi:hypothetical protein